MLALGLEPEEGFDRRWVIGHWCVCVRACAHTRYTSSIQHCMHCDVWVYAQYGIVRIHCAVWVYMCAIHHTVTVCCASVMVSACTFRCVCLYPWRYPQLVAHKAMAQFTHNLPSPPPPHTHTTSLLFTLSSLLSIAQCMSFGSVLQKMLPFLLQLRW